MNWLIEKFERFRQQSFKVICVTIFAKFLFGVGLGILLVSYLQAIDWIAAGWLAIAVSLLLHIPAIYAVFIRK